MKTTKQIIREAIAAQEDVYVSRTVTGPERNRSPSSTAA
jgi:hypothetical protein